MGPTCGQQLWALETIHDGVVGKQSGVMGDETCLKCMAGRQIKGGREWAVGFPKRGLTFAVLWRVEEQCMHKANLFICAAGPEASWTATREGD